MNGSFVIPIKYISGLTKEKIWLYHTVVGIFILPWVFLFLFMPASFHVYAYLSLSIIFLMVFGGVIFGLGQICFSYAIEDVGIGLGFSVNLGIGIVIGSLFVVFYHHEFFSTHGCLVTFSVILILLSLLLNYFATNISKHPIQSSTHYQRGWLLASIAGISSGFQNVVFIIVMSNSALSSTAINPFLIWPPFLLAAAVPMFLGFYYRSKKIIPKKIKINYVIVWFKNAALITLMGLFFTGSLLLYSTSMMQLKGHDQIIGWPIFMVAIILASRLWGWRYKELTASSVREKTYKIISVLLLLISIILLSIKS